MPIADIADALEVAFDRRNSSHGRADHRFGNKCHHRFRTESLDFGFKLGRHALAVIEIRFAFVPAAIGVTGRDMGGFDQQRRKLLAAPFIATGCQGAERIAVIALPTRDHPMPLRLADLEKILPCKLDRGLDGFRSAAYQVDSVKTGRGVGCQQIGQSFRRFRSEKTRMGKGDFVQLPLDRLGDIGIAVPKAGNRRSTRPIR